MSTLVDLESPPNPREMASNCLPLLARASMMAFCELYSLVSGWSWSFSVFLTWVLGHIIWQNSNSKFAWFLCTPRMDICWDDQLHMDATLPFGLWLAPNFHSSGWWCGMDIHRPWTCGSSKKCQNNITVIVELWRSLRVPLAEGNLADVCTHLGIEVDSKKSPLSKW